MKVKFTEGNCLNRDFEGLLDCNDFIGLISRNHVNHENQGSRQ